MDIPQYQVNAFSTRQFGGNPAAVVPLDAWLGNAIMQGIAAENNLSETAFYVAQADAFALRWFTPEVEVDLCGHATLATAHVLYTELGYRDAELQFMTRSGALKVRRLEAGYGMDFPAYPSSAVPVDGAVQSALGATVLDAWRSSFLLCVLEDEAAVSGLQPDFGALLAASDVPVIVTAPGESTDFVSRFFGPQVGLDEDPVTGSAHCALAPLWSGVLGKSRLTARQVSARGGDLVCDVYGDRVRLEGEARTFLRGSIRVEI